MALLGTTGAGKSSLVHLIPRFYDVTSGKVTVDGVDVRDLDQDTLRRKISALPFRKLCFSAEPSEIISVTDARMPPMMKSISAAKAAQAHDFIMSFPEGYNTQLGQRGVNLSGGQKQRIAIARAIASKARQFLSWMTAPAAVDVETESKIQDALEKIMHERKLASGTASTSFVIAQRISTVLKADKILVLDDGQIAAQGTHR